MVERCRTARGSHEAPGEVLDGRSACPPGGVRRFGKRVPGQGAGFLDGACSSEAVQPIGSGTVHRVWRARPGWERLLRRGQSRFSRVPRRLDLRLRSRWVSSHFTCPVPVSPSVQMSAGRRWSESVHVVLRGGARSRRINSLAPPPPSGSTSAASPSPSWSPATGRGTLPAVALSDRPCARRSRRPPRHRVGGAARGAGYRVERYRSLALV